MLQAFLKDAIQEIGFLYRNHSDVPVLEDDITFGGMLLDEYAKITAKQNHSVSIDVLRKLLVIADRILGAPTLSISLSRQATIR